MSSRMRLQHKTYKNYLEASRKESINETIGNCRNEQKRLFNAVSNLIGNRKLKPITGKFIKYGASKWLRKLFYLQVDMIRKAMGGHEIYRPTQPDVPQFTAFPVAETDILKLIQNAQPTTCDLDLIQSLLVKQHQGCICLRDSSDCQSVPVLWKLLPRIWKGQSSGHCCKSQN